MMFRQGSLIKFKEQIDERLLERGHLHQVAAALVFRAAFDCGWVDGGLSRAGYRSELLVETAEACLFLFDGGGCNTF